LTEHVKVGVGKRKTTEVQNLVVLIVAIGGDVGQLQCIGEGEVARSDIW